MIKLIILGITGSIGSNALRGVSQYRDNIRIVGASVNTNVEKALKICSDYDIKNLCITSDAGYTSQNGIKIYKDINLMLSEIDADMVLNGISGSAGLSASIYAIDNGLKLALANKETIVLGGRQFFDFVKSKNGTVIPVDSEHSAIDELLNVHKAENVSKLVITASGGPFLKTPLAELEKIKPETAVKHPTWKMGPKISIDSSTLANKGLEVIEAHYLFNFDADDIEVVIHPQSIVHSMVRTLGGQIYAQMSPPDMVFPIMRAILEGKFTRPVSNELDFTSLNLSFSKPDYSRFPFLSDAFECVKKEGIYPIIYNIADEIAVDAFMKGKIRFTDIRNVVRKALDTVSMNVPSDIHDIPMFTQELKKNITL